MDDVDTTSTAAADTSSISETTVVIHERQSLQLCAIHAVNNLLQLSEETRHLDWLCGTQRVPRDQEQLVEATKSEFDQIADELTLAENRLLQATGEDSAENPSGALQGDEEDEVPQQPTWSSRVLCQREMGPSVYQKFTSNHRTVYLGNYSFEVMETALTKRGVALSWFKPDVSDGIARTEQGKLVIGFIVHSIDKEDSMFGLSRILQKVPFLGAYFDYGRHWYAISRIQRCPSSRTEGWKILDSDLDEVEYCTSEAVFEHLKRVCSEDGTVFRATISQES